MSGSPAHPLACHQVGHAHDGLRVRGNVVSPPEVVALSTSVSVLGKLTRDGAMRLVRTLPVVDHGRGALGRVKRARMALPLLPIRT
jgi:hypothetical protein